MEHTNDTVDLREIGVSLRRGAAWIVGGGIIGVLAALLLIKVTRPQYEGTATVLLRSASETPSLLSQLGPLAGMMGGGLGGALGGSEIETEMQILTSRAVIGTVVDSLGMQAEVRSPSGTPAGELFASAELPVELTEGEYEFERSGDAYRVTGPAGTVEATPGVPARIGGAVLTLSTADLPESFVVALLDRAEAIDELIDNLDVPEPTGEVAELTYRSTDRTLSAEVPNRLIAEYLNRRRTTDRGANQRRYEFLVGAQDSINGELLVASRALRVAQESSGVVDAEITGTAEMERAMELRAGLEDVEVEARAFERILGRDGGISAREMAAYPTFLSNPAINDLLSRVLELETERAQLLQRRTERDDEVIALGQGIRNLEAQLATISRDYLAGLNQQRVEFRQELSRYQSSLGALPGQAEMLFRLEREVRRLTETLIAIQAQTVQARLAAIGEGGEVRQIDVAAVPEEPAFPSPTLHVLGGLVGGLFFGLMGVIGSTKLRQKVREPWEAELATGLTTVRLDRNTPLAFAELRHSRAAMLVPVGRRADAEPAAGHLAATARLQGRTVAVVDLAQGVAAEPAVRRLSLAAAGAAPEETGGAVVRTAGGERLAVRLGTNGDAPAEPRHLLAEFEGQNDLVVVALPGLGNPVTVSVLTPDRPVVLVACSGAVTRHDLLDAIALCTRMSVSVVGIILHAPAKKNDAAA